ncbi:50S ribosomal subunit L30, partial [Hortaea werneckii]
AARDIGVYNAYGDEGWNDEVLVGDDVSEPSTTVERLIRDAEGRPIVDVESQKEEEEQKSVEGAKRELQRVEVERPMSRETEADRKNDQRSLNRKLDRALYLMVKNKEGIWRFPEDRVYGRENLHQAAERILIQSAGINMNTFLIGNHPIGHHAQKYTRPITSTLSANRLVPTSTIARAGEEGSVREEYGEKVFFMKARIMAGQADLSKNEYGDQEFKWLAKEEVQDVVTQAYWSSVKNMLTER